jgi:hypothetical protein
VDSSGCHGRGPTWTTVTGPARAANSSALIRGIHSISLAIPGFVDTFTYSQVELTVKTTVSSSLRPSAPCQSVRDSGGVGRRGMSRQCTTSDAGRTETGGLSGSLNGHGRISRSQPRTRPGLTRLRPPSVSQTKSPSSQSYSSNVAIGSPSVRSQPTSTPDHIDP